MHYITVVSFYGCLKFKDNFHRWRAFLLKINANATAVERVRIDKCIYTLAIRFHEPQKLYSRPQFIAMALCKNDDVENSFTKTHKMFASFNKLLPLRQNRTFFTQKEGGACTFARQPNMLKKKNAKKFRFYPWKLSNRKWFFFRIFFVLCVLFFLLCSLL